MNIYEVYLENMADNKVEHFKILSLNFRGLNNAFKRKQIFRFLRKKKANIFCLQDVHFTADQEQLIKECYISPYKSNARGTAILFNNNFEFEVLSSFVDKNEGNYVGLNVKIEDQIYSIITIYGPNTDNPKFFRTIRQKLEDLQGDIIKLSCVETGIWF